MELLELTTILFLLATSIASSNVILQPNQLPMPYLVFEHENLDPNCEGSLVLLDTEYKLHYIQGNESILSIEVLTAEVHGCGCFTVHKGRNGKGASRTLTNGQKLHQKHIGFKKIKSVSRKSCYKSFIPRIIPQPQWLFL